MDAIIKHANEEGLQLVKKEIPKIEFGEALVKIHYKFSLYHSIASFMPSAKL